MPRLRLLLLEDAPDDAELTLAALAEAGIACDTEYADGGPAFERAFQAGRFDAVIADYHLHGYTGLDALAHVRRADALLPFILVSGALGEERAVDALRAGATDFVLKDNLLRLPRVVTRALEEVRLRRQHLATQQALELSERRYRAIVEDQQELIIRMQPDSTVNFVNGAYCRYFGYQPDQIRGRPILESMTAENREALRRNLAGISPQAPSFERESLVRHASGAGRWLHWSGRGIFDGRGVLAEVQAVGRDVTELRGAMDELAAARERLQGLSRRLLEVQESERKSLARELHDDIGQALTALKLGLEALQRSRDGAAQRARIAEALDTTQHILERVRQLSLSLRPLQLDDLGLAAALRSHLDRQAVLGDFAPHPAIQDFPARLPPELETACFRVAQEAVNNIVRHARARNVWLQLAEEGASLVLTVRDDGGGFDVEAARRRAALGQSLGVVSMAERAALAGGELRIESAPGAGTTVRAAFPLAREA
jgi:two-component system sensor histidine kinase UhpB